MFKQSVTIIDFPELYNVLYELKHLFEFNIYNYKYYKDFLSEVELNNTNNFIIILKQKDHPLIKNNKIDKRTTLIFDNLPLKLERLLDKINIKFIKQKYQFQSKLSINSYDLDLNARIISNNEVSIKLTEKEIEIILFLNNKKNAQSVLTLQNQVWGYSSKLETHTVETHIYRLRKKIKRYFKDEKFITNFENGYKI
tara:strand:- start:1244 stop:1834 length:591 start_codon:yes stop_codon:yes gene_type:complete